MATAIAKNRELSDQPATNVVSEKFSPVSVNGRMLINETDSAGTQDSASRPLIEIGVRRMNVDSQRQRGHSSEPNRDDERLLNARQVADKLGVSERFIRDHTTRRSPKIPAVKLGKLIRYRRADVDVFMAQLGTLSPSSRSRFGV
jgi:excisionase family DNA binding protein